MSLYADLLFSGLYPFYESTLRKRKTFDHYRFLMESQWYEPDRLAEHQFKEIKKLLEHAYEQVPFYRDVFRKLDATPADIKNHDDFAKLPIIDKDVIRANREQMVAKNHIGATIHKTTGGSTGEPLQFEYTRESYEWRVATRMRGYGWAGFREGEKVAFIWGTAIGEPTRMQRLKESLHNGFLRWKFFNCFELDGKFAADICRQLVRFGPSVIVGYATPTYNLALSIRKQGLKPPRVASVLTAAEKVQGFQREVIEEVFGCRVFNTYGSREFMLMASECDAHEGLHVHMENVCAEIVHGDKGLDKKGPGELVITDLHNFGMPFIRYRIGDLGIPSTRDKCSCGRGLTLIDDVEGRLLDTILTPEGRMVPGEFFPHLAKEFDEIKQFQVVQDSVDRLLVKIVQSREFTGDSLQRFRTEVEKVVGGSVHLDIQIVDEIPTTATGKFRVTISNIWNDNQV